jgi:hypothetical protein
MLRDNQRPIDRAEVLAEQLEALSKMLLPLVESAGSDVVTLAYVIHEKAVEIGQTIELIDMEGK